MHFSVAKKYSSDVLFNNLQTSILGNFLMKPYTPMSRASAYLIINKNMGLKGFVLMFTYNTIFVLNNIQINI